MSTFVALLRGINVGGRSSLKMDSLRAVVTEAGATAVETYIQSGNVVLRHPGRSTTRLRDDLERRLLDATGRDIAVVVRTAAEFAAVVAADPFPDADRAHRHVAFLRDRPPPDLLAGLDADAHGPETAALVGAEVHLHLPNGMGRATLPVALGRLRPPSGGGAPVATVRNWRTVEQLLAMTSED